MSVHTERPAPPRDRNIRRRKNQKRPPYLRRRIVFLAVLLLITLGVLSWFTPLIGVKNVEILGTKALSQAEVKDTAGVPQGRSLFRLDLTGIQARVAAMPRVAAVTVERSWPWTVRLRITERVPVAIYKEAETTRLVDGTGMAYADATDSAAGLPELKVERPATDDQATTAAMRVLAVLPDAIKAEVLTITAASPADVRLTMSRGREVRWGSGADSARKAAVLGPLLTQTGKIYNVSAPDLPTVTP